MGYTVIDPLSDHQHSSCPNSSGSAPSHELFSRQEAKRVLDRVTADNPKVVEDLVPKLLTLATARRVFQNLLRERVSIRDAVSVLESLGGARLRRRGIRCCSPIMVQQSRSGALWCDPYLNQNGDLAAWFDGSTDRTDRIEGQRGAWRIEQLACTGAPRCSIARPAGAVRNALWEHRNLALVVITAARVAAIFLRQAVESSMPNLVFLGHSEIPAGVKVISLGIIQ